MRLIDADALKSHYSWWSDENEYKKIFDDMATKEYKEIAIDDYGAKKERRMAVALVFKDRHLPTNCEECFLCNDHFFGFYKCRYAELWGTRKRRADDCPLIEMPTQEDGTQFKGLFYAH